MRSALLLFATAALSQAQFVSTDDGSRLFFTTANRIASTDQSFRSKLFSWDARNGIRLVHESEGDVGLIAISGDGSIASIRVICDSCAEREQSYLIHTATGTPERLLKPSAMSRNGRFLFDGQTLTDRATGESRRYSAGAIQFSVGNDGSVLYKTLDAFHRIDRGGADVIIGTGARFTNFGDVDENATRAIVIGPAPAPVLLDAVTGEMQPLRSEFGAMVSNTARLSADGEWAASVFPPPPGYAYEVQLCRTAGTACKLLTTPPITAYPIAISRRGEVVYAAYFGAILRIESDTGRTEQPFILPSVRPQQGAQFVPGSTIRLASENPGTFATVNGEPVPVLGREEGALFVQIPWTATGMVEFTMAGGESPFEASTQRYRLTDFHPQAIAPRDKGPLENSAYRQDWSATTYESPARPGEILHAIVTGLGAVSCAIGTNQPAPLDRLCPITRTVDWRWYPSGQPAEVLFAGLAPGLIGIYQIDVRVPADAETGFMALSDNAGHPRIVWVQVSR